MPCLLPCRIYRGGRARPPTRNKSLRRWPAGAPMPAISTVTLCEHVRTWRRPLGRHSVIYGSRTSGAYFVCSTLVGVLHRRRLAPVDRLRYPLPLRNIQSCWLAALAEVEVGSIVGGTPVRIIRCMYVCSVCMLWHVMGGWLFGSVNFGL
jgi:hypothetical protein